MVDQIIFKKDPPGNSRGIFCFENLLIVFFVFQTLLIYSQAKIKVLEPKINFGSVQRGEVIKNNFEIVNAGNQPLVITGADVSCSCTTVDYPKEPILPGEKKIILVNFNTTTVYGRQDRIVLLNSNDPSGSVKLRYKGMVSKK